MCFTTTALRISNQGVRVKQQIFPKNLKLEVTKVDTELKETSTISEYNKTHEELKANVNKLREQLMTNKFKKFKRDTRDYQFNKVYTWAK